MHILILKFDVSKLKLYEFDLAFRKLVKWPVYSLRKRDESLDSESFEVIRIWDTKTNMEEELSSNAFTNLIGVVKVLGTISESKVYEVSSEAELQTES